MNTDGMTIRSFKTAGAVMACAAIVLWSAWASAQSRIELTTVAEVERQIVDAKDNVKVERTPAKTVMPGETLVFTIYYENTGTGMAEKAVITNPIPEHLVYAVDSAEGVDAEITYSIDGGTSFRKAAELFVKDKAGRQFPARPGDYTHIRWTIKTPLAPGATGAVSFKATIQ